MNGLTCQHALVENHLGRGGMGGGLDFRTHMQSVASEIIEEEHGTKERPQVRASSTQGLMVLGTTQLQFIHHPSISGTGVGG